MDETLKSFWIEHQPNLWDQVVFHIEPSADGPAASTLAEKAAAALQFPFRCRYRGRISMKIDQQQASQQQGGATRSSGRKGAGIDFTVMLYEPEHLALYGTFLRMLQGRRSESSVLVRVHHPALNLLGIERLQFQSATLPTRNSARDVLTSTLSFVEYLSPPSPKFGELMSQNDVSTVFTPERPSDEIDPQFSV